MRSDGSIFKNDFNKLCIWIIFYQILRLTLFDVTDLSVKSAGIIGAIIVIIVFCLSIFLAFKL